MGALTGVRPGKLMTPLLKSGMSGEAAVREFEEKYDVSPERAELCLETSRVTLAAEASLAPEDVCLYVGIPFCPTRCAYCSFVSQSVEKSMKLIDPFVAALFKEVRATAAEVRALGLRVVSIYMGGGTPTTLSAPQLDALCAPLAEEFDLSALREYTVEAGRPDTITDEKLAVLHRHGVDRISVNPQTMSDAVLDAIGRRHTAADIVDALGKVRAAGGFDVNMDLIAGLPSDTPEGFNETPRARTRPRAGEHHRAHAVAEKGLAHHAGGRGAAHGGGGRRDAGRGAFRAHRGGVLALLPLPAEVHVRRV